MNSHFDFPVYVAFLKETWFWSRKTWRGSRPCLTAGSTTMTLSTLATKAFSGRWPKWRGTPPPLTSGSACATPATSTSGSGQVQCPPATWTGPRDKDQTDNMAVVLQAPLRPLGGSSGSACPRQKRWTLFAQHVLGERSRPRAFSATENFKLSSYHEETFTSVFNLATRRYQQDENCRASKVPTRAHIWHQLVRIQLLASIVGAEFH